MQIDTGIYYHTPAQTYKRNVIGFLAGSNSSPNRRWPDPAIEIGTDIFVAQAFELSKTLLQV